MQQIAQQLGSLPIQIIYLSNGCIGFARMKDFATIFDQAPEGKISAVLTNENMLVGNTEIEYNRMLDYKNMPELLAWLKQQNLVSPI